MDININQLLNGARKNKDPNGVRAFSRVLAAMQTARGRTGKDLTEPEILKIIAGEIAVLNEEIGFLSEGEFEKANDLAESILVLNKLLPAKVDPAEYDSIVMVAIMASGAECKKEMSKVMRYITENYGTTVDMKEIAKLVQKELP